MIYQEYLRKDEPFHNTLIGLRNKLMDYNFSRAMYAAMCNMRWQLIENTSEAQIYSCSWRYAGGLVAQIRDVGEDYLDFYCSGREGRVAEDVRLTLKDKGWESLPYEEE